MIPPKTLKNIVLVNKLSWIFGPTPYRFLKDPETNEKVLVPSFTKWRILYIYGTFCALMAYISFLILRLLFTVIFHDDYTLKFVVQMTYQIFGFSQIAVIHFTSVYMLREVPQFFMCAQRYFRYIKENYILPGQWGPRCLNFFYAWYVVAFIVNSQNLVLLIKKPDRPHFYTSLLENPKKVPMLHRLPFMILQIMVWTTAWPQVITLCFHLYSNMSCLVWTIRELNIGITTPKTRNALRESRTFTKQIRTLQVLHGMWLHAHQGFFCPAHKLVAIMVATLGTYGLIKLSGPAAIAMGCMAAISTLYVWTLFSKFGQLYSVSKDVLENWLHSSTSSKWLRKFVMSIPVFCVKVGFFYRVERTTVFTALLTILNNTITLLFL